MISLKLAKLLKEKGYRQVKVTDRKISNPNWSKETGTLPYYSVPDLIDVLDWLEKEYGYTKLYLQRYANDYIQAELITALTNGVSFGGGKTRSEAIENAVLKVLEGKK